MKKHLAIAAAVLLSVSFLILPFAWAETAHHDRSENHDHHAEMSAGDAETSERDAKPGGIFDGYFAIFASLSQDSMKDVRANARTLAAAAEKAEKEAKNSLKHDHSLHTLLGDIKATAKSLSKTIDIGSARAEFGTLSEKLVEYRKKHEENGSDSLIVFRCDMAKKVWLQKNEDPGNPYFGPSMAMCRRKIN